MTPLTHTKEKCSQANLRFEAPASCEAEQIVHLKRLLVTLKQHYEKSLQTSHAQLQAEQNQKIALQKELDSAKEKLIESRNLHEEELRALRDQHVMKELLQKQTQDFPLSTSLPDLQYLRQEFEGIKRTLSQGAKETNALEVRYVEVLNEKIRLEHQFKQLQQQFEDQSSHVYSFQMRVDELEEHKRALETVLQSKDTECARISQQCQELQKKESYLGELAREKEYIQEKYEQLKEEWKELTAQLEDAVEVRKRAEQQVSQLEIYAKEQETHLQEHIQHMHLLEREKQSVETEREQLRNYLEECEARLKVAQQHLAKKVKEATLLSERVEEQQVSLADFVQTIELQKTQTGQLQADLDLYQKQEKRLQEQLHDALKATESQVAKWEEKYFRMYDNWQESETRIRELKKLEEKHHQMQSLLSNLGSFMGNSLNSGGIFPPIQESADRLNPSTGLEEPQTEETSSTWASASAEEKYDLFGMRQSSDKYKSNLFP